MSKYKTPLSNRFGRLQLTKTKRPPIDMTSQRDGTDCNLHYYAGIKTGKAEGIKIGQEKAIKDEIEFLNKLKEEDVGEESDLVNERLEKLRYFILKTLGHQPSRRCNENEQ